MKLRWQAENNKKECNFGFVTCRFANGQYCDRRPIKEWKEQQ